MAEIKEIKVYINPYKLFVGAFIPNWLLCRKDIGFGAKLCYAKLCQYAGKNGECFPKQTSIAKDIGCGRRQVIRYIQELIDFSLIDAVKTEFQGRNVYKFLQHLWMDPLSMRVKPNVTDMTQLAGKNSQKPAQPNVTQTTQLDSSKCDKNGTPNVTYLVGPIYEENQLRESIESIYRLWNDQKIITHRNIKQFKPAISTALNDYKPDEVKKAIINYAMVVKDEKCFFKYKWTLEQFLSRKGVIDRFMPENFNINDYKKNTGKSDQPKPPVITEKQLEEKFGRIATKEMIKNFLRTTPQSQWWVLDKYLARRYPERNGFGEAERELIAEARKNKDQLSAITAGIGKAV